MAEKDIRKELDDFTYTLLTINQAIDHLYEGIDKCFNMIEKNHREFIKFREKVHGKDDRQPQSERKPPKRNRKSKECRKGHEEGTRGKNV